MSSIVLIANHLKLPLPVLLFLLMFNRGSSRFLLSCMYLVLVSCSSYLANLKAFCMSFKIEKNKIETFSFLFSFSFFVLFCFCLAPAIRVWFLLRNRA